MAAPRPRALPLLQPTPAAAPDSSVGEAGPVGGAGAPPQGAAPVVGLLEAEGADDDATTTTMWDAGPRGDLATVKIPPPHPLLDDGTPSNNAAAEQGTLPAMAIAPGTDPHAEAASASASSAVDATANKAHHSNKPRRYLPANKKPPGPPPLIEEYEARLYFRGCLCREGDPYVSDDLATHNLFHYTSPAYKDHVVRFDPAVYPVEGGLEGPGAIRLIRDVKNCYAESLNLHRGSPHLRDAQRRLFCLRGDVRKSSHIVQTCRCNVHLILRTDRHSHYLKGGKGCAIHTGHARIVDLGKFRPLPAAVAPTEAAATGEVMEGYHPDRVVVIDPDHVPPASIQVGSDDIVSYPARIAFEGAPCLLDEPYGQSKLTMLELYSYTHPRCKHMVVRFDPLKYPIEGGFDGDGWKALMADLKDRSEDPLCLHSVAVQDRDRLRRLCCRRGQMHHAKFVVQTCHCPVRILIHKDDQTFYLKCGECGSVHQGHPPLPKVYSQRGIPKRKNNPDGTLAAACEPGGMAPCLAASSSSKADSDEPLTLPPSKTAKRLWPYVTQLVEALEGQPWQKADAAGRQVQEITDAILQRKRDRGDRGGGEPNLTGKSHKRPSHAAPSGDDDVNEAASHNHHHAPPMQPQQPQAQPAPQMLLPPPHGPPYHHQAVYQPFPPQQNLYWL